MKEIILIGGGGHCKSVIDVIEKEGRFKIAGIVDVPELLGTEILGYPIIGNDSDIENHDGHVHQEHSEALEMNDGKKWEVNTDMMVHVRAMETNLVTFDASEVKDYPALATDLKASIGKLTSSCTMTGKSHDELHKWLLPFINTVDALKDAASTEDAAQEATKIQSLMETFNSYFE